MIETRTLKRNSVAPFLGKLRAAGYRILAPVNASSGASRFETVGEDFPVNIQGTTTVSAKIGVFPLVEEILRFRKESSLVQIEGQSVEATPTVLYGVRPCDARALLSMDSVFLSPPVDPFYKARREAAVVVACSCSSADPDCFCTSVGGGPGNAEGADVLLTEISDDDYLAEVITEKGRNLVSTVEALFQPAGDTRKQDYLADVPVRFALDEVKRKLPLVFDRDSLWQGQSLACLGCGTCAFLCPTCSCFDLQDEADLKSGSRLRCWDSCGQRLFTLHASGHNPRPTQGQRWRQRVMHKFSYLPESRETVGCVGCGRCSRSCPAGVNLLEHLMAIAEIQI